MSANDGETLLLDQHLETEDPVSGGERRIAALREAFASDTKTLLLDEPTNDLDVDARAWLVTEIENFPGAMIIVTHDPALLDVVDEIWELRAGKIACHPAGFADFVERLDAEEARLRDEIDSLRSESRKANEKARALVESQQKRMVRGEKAAEKANVPKVMRGNLKRRAEATLARNQAVGDRKSTDARDRLRDASARLREISLFEWDSAATRPPAGKRLALIREANLPGFNRPLTLELNGARRVRLTGKNGSGKSTLLRALAGDEGARERAPGAYHLTEAHHLFDQSLSRFATDESLWEWFTTETKLETSVARSILGRLGFEQEDQLRPVTALSGGERVRLEIALALHAKEPPQILLLDEPTNHLDLESRKILRDFIERFEGAILLVTHDEAFATSVRLDETIDLDDHRGP